MQANANNIFRGSPHTHALSIKIKGPFPMAQFGPEGFENNMDTGSFYLVKFHFHVNPAAPPQKTEIIVPEEMIHDVIQELL